MKKLVVIYSGGMDSFTALHKAVKEGFDVVGAGVKAPLFAA